jgi:hypothetical protein
LRFSTLQVQIFLFLSGKFLTELKYILFIRYSASHL